MWDKHGKLHMKNSFKPCTVSTCSKLSALCILVLLFLLYLQYDCFTSINWNLEQQQRVATESSLNSTVVLLWNQMFADARWTLPTDTLEVTCPRVNCVITNQHDYLSSVEQYTAIVFHTARAFSYFNALPVRRDPRQWYIFAQLESPENTYNQLRHWRRFFNLTMSYRLDSDIVWSYNRVTDKLNNETIAPAWQPAWRPIDTTWTQTDVELLAMIGKKRKLVAWFVSNCRVQSAREKLVQKLQSLVPLDIYGKCGNLDDYVTEKFYNAMERQLVPIVYGGANYTRFAPPYSYIDAQAFENVTALAAYLLYLDKTPQEYAKYFWWKRYYSVSGKGLQLLPVCELCERVSVPDTLQRTQIYDDIDRYWRQNACMQHSSIKF